MTTRVSAALALLLASAMPARAFDPRFAPVPGRAPSAIEAGGIATDRADRRPIFGNLDGTLGQGALRDVRGPGRGAVEQGDATDLVAKAPGAPQGRPLGAWLTTPYFSAAASPNGTDAYGSGRATGQAALASVSTDASTVTGKERYGAFFAYAGPGTGDPAVIGTSFGIGGAAIKRNWQSTTVPGQMVAANLIARCGYFGPDAAAALPQFGGYNPAGDCSGALSNTVQASPYGQNAVLEGAVYYAPGGHFNDQVRSMNVQLGPMRQRNPDGSVANPGIGLALSATSGALGYAVQVNNTARADSYAYAPGSWAGFLRYNRDTGLVAPYDAFRVDGDGSIVVSSGGATTPTKRIRAAGGNLEILNDSGTVIAALSDAGALTLGAGAAARTVLTTPGAWTAYAAALAFDGGSTAAGTVSARYQIVGKTLDLAGTFAITSVGRTAGFGVYVPLPPGVTIAHVCPGIGNEFAVNGKMLNIRAGSRAARLTLTNFDNSSAVQAGAQGQFAVRCEID